MHGLEEGTKGRTAFASRGEPGWHLLGTVFPEDEHVTTSDMLDKAHMSGWNIRLIEAPLTVGDLTLVSDKTDYYVVRDNPFVDGQVDRLGVVGERYRVFQNEQLFAFGDALLDGGGQWETAGSIMGGRRVFGSLKLDHNIVLDPEGAADEIFPYLLVTAGHDGSFSIVAMTTPVRVVCQNTLGLALEGVKQAFKMRHTDKVDGRVAEAKKALSLSHAYLDKFEEEARALYEVALSGAQFSKIITTIYPKPENDSKAALTRWENKIDLLGDIFNGAVENAPNTVENIKGTAWAGLNALTERLDWYRTPRKGEIESVAAAMSGFDAVAAAEKNRVVKEFKALVGV